MVLAKRPPVRALTIFLAKPGVTENQLVERNGQLTETPIRAGRRRIGTLYSKAVGTHHPKWVTFFGDSIDAAALGLWSASASAALILKVGERIVAVTFGYGRHLLAPEMIENSFGLRVTLACVGDNGVRSIDRETFEGLTTHVREQSSKETSLSDFGLNVERDLLRAVVGTPGDNRYGERLTGMDALSASCRVTLETLPALVDTYIVKANDDGYKVRYPWIDNISEVKDKLVLSSLEEALLTEIKARSFARKWLAVPDLMEWTDIAGFRYTDNENAELLADIHFETYLDQLRRPDDLSLARMRAQRVVAFSATTDKPRDRWPLFNCVYAEVDRDDGTYLLNNGCWYHLDADFVAKIDRVVGAIPSSNLSFPPMSSGEDEATYNRRLAQSLGQCCVMDAKNIVHGGGSSAVEFCDVFTSSKRMIHVKRYRGSSVLSHLFAQGSVAAAAFVSDAEFRRQLNLKLPQAFRMSNPLQRPQARHYEVAYVIASRSAGSLRLPFFSRVTLRNALNHLEAFGFKVTLTKVAIA